MTCAPSRDNRPYCMKRLPLHYILALTAILPVSAANPYLPLWEHIPDGEPYLFDDPDRPGTKRVYVYGSHDMLRTQYCGTDQVVWSAPADSLDCWRYDGVIFESRLDADGNPLHSDGRGDVLYAPDVTEVTGPDGKKTYYLYPNNQESGRTGMVAKSDRPDGPFEVINWSADNPQATTGILGFDPAVFVDDDGRVYAYWGFGNSYACELDPKTMATPLPGTELVKDIVTGFKEDGDGRFYEASSIRKIGDKYVFIYSRVSADGEWGLPSTNYTLAYAYGDSPLGPFTYGGTIIDARGRDTDADGNPIVTATPNGNTHGSLLDVNGRWWVFYHRQTGVDEYARQAMVAPVEVEVTPGPGGKVTITEAEYTSEGFETGGLDPLRRYPAAIASHFTGPMPARQKYPVVNYSGPYFEPSYCDDHNISDPYGDDVNCNRVVNNTDGSVLGYKYFDFGRLYGRQNIRLLIDLIPEDVPGTIEVYTSAPWKGNPVPAGRYRLGEQPSSAPVRIEIPLDGVSELSGKHPLYLAFSSPRSGVSICSITHLQFVCE